MTPMVDKIVAAQEHTPATERAKWSGSSYSTAVLGARILHLYRGRLIVPEAATELKTILMRMAHDDNEHYSGAQRTVVHLQAQARVHWVGLQADVQKYVNSCFRCQIAKAESHGKRKVGTLQPTAPPGVHHTWYADMKGPLPHGTGYIFAVVEAVTRMVKLRYVDSTAALDISQSLQDIFDDYGTRPVVLRTDGGPPFNSEAFDTYCTTEGMHLRRGVPDHSQGQGLVETRFRGVAASIMAVLGHKAPREWWMGKGLRRLEGVINATFCDSIHGSPYWAMHGREPRTRLSALSDWTTSTFGLDVLHLDTATFDDYQEIVTQHHAQMHNTQGRAMLGSCVAQAITKREWDSEREGGDISVGQQVLMLHVAPNKLLPHFRGPYTVHEVSGDKNFIVASHYATPDKRESPAHVSRIIPFDDSRVTRRELDEFFHEGAKPSYSVLGHRYTDGGAREYHVQRHAGAVPTWEKWPDVWTKDYVVAYNTLHKETLAAEAAAAAELLAKRRARTAKAVQSAVSATALESAAAVSSGAATVGRIKLSKTALRGVLEDVPSGRVDASVSRVVAGAGVPVMPERPEGRRQLLGSMLAGTGRVLPDGR